RRAAGARARRRRGCAGAVAGQPRRRERRWDGNPSGRGRAGRLQTATPTGVSRLCSGTRGMLMQPLESYRDRFPILEHTTYLINHSLGAMPVRPEENLRRYAREWRERGVRAWAEGWWDTSMTLGDQLGRIIGAPPGSTVMHQNVAGAQAS